MHAMQTIKQHLVRRGPDSALVQGSLKAHGRLKGFKVRFSDDRIFLQKLNRDMILSKSYYVQVPVMMECYDLFFDTIDGIESQGRIVLDFSGPGLHRYKKSNVAFHFPSVPEDDVMDAYTHWYLPRPGDVVWDAGAHAGASSYFLAQLVGPSGKVYAFEPDDDNFEYLLRNLEMHHLTNVVPVRKALCDKTGSATFCMDGTMNSGIGDYLTYSGAGRVKTVPTLSIADACSELGAVPAYIKMDIEGAELVSIRAAAEFLKSHPIQFAIETHLVGKEYTDKPLEQLFPTFNYEVSSSNWKGQVFTWARPISSHA
jgi:FkbM family methyltransferase